MKKEYEIVSNTQFKYLNVFLVSLFSRTPHIHKEFELGVILDGSLTIKIDGQICHIKKGSLYLVNSMDTHEFITDEFGALILVIQVSPKLFEPFFYKADRLRFLAPITIEQILSESNNSTLYRLCQELALHYYKHDPYYEFLCFSLSTQIFYILSSSLPTKILSKHDFLPMTRRTDRMVEIVDYIDNNFQNKLLLEDIAAMHHISMPHLSHLFRETLGLSFQDYLQKKRFEHAFPLISKTDRTILDISIESGFSDVRYLISAFRNEFGCSPKEYRRQINKQPRNVQSKPGNLQYFLTQDEVVNLLESVI